MDNATAGQIKGKLGKLFKAHGRNLGCLNPDCNSKNPIGSHSVSRYFLNEIAEHGHVYIFDRNIDDVAANTGASEPLSKASKFRGFCKSCDNKLFEPFEKHPIQLTNDHLFRISFRSVAKEYHTKKSILDFYKKELPPEHLRSLHVQQEYVRMQYIEKFFGQMSDALTEGSFQKLKSWAFIFDGPPTWLCSSLMMPDVLPSNRRVQIMNWQPFTVDWIPYNGFLCCIISFLNSQSKKPKRFCQAFEALSASKSCLAQLIMALDNIENIFFKPSFIDSLTAFEKRYIYDLFFAFAESSEVVRYPNFLKFPHFKFLPKLKEIIKI